MIKLVQLTAAALVIASAPALAQGTPAQQGAAAPLKPAVVYDLGGKFDKSFNEGVYNGAEAFKKETGVEYRDFEPQNEAQKEQALRRFAREGFSPIVAVGFSQQSAVEKTAAEFPNIRFAIIDAVVDKPNVRSITFKEHEGSYLVGLLGAMRRRPAGSASSAAWTSRSSANSPAAMCRASRPRRRTRRSSRA